MPIRPPLDSPERLVRQALEPGVLPLNYSHPPKQPFLSDGWSEAAILSGLDIPLGSSPQLNTSMSRISYSAGWSG